MCLEESIYIHNIKDMKLLKTILDIPANPTGELPRPERAPSNLSSRGSFHELQCLCLMSLSGVYPGLVL